MKLSLIIVNYNVCTHLRRSLDSVIRACNGIDYEIFVVDNASTDKSVAMVKEEFPTVHLIANKKNEGFSKGNNQALELAQGEFVVLLNPDTIIKRDTFQKTLEFMDKHPVAGGLGVRMISPQGHFQPESIRGLTPQWISFFKLTGLSKMFSKSRLYDRNHKNWIEEFETAEVDILSASFMMVRRAALLQTGLMDERFFMYGADIDLSYRLRQVGFKNYYFPKTYIIHFKGQSTRKFTWQFIKNYYGAMLTFAGKYMFRLPKLQIKMKGVEQPYPSLYEVE